jgi:hypothetical protein
MSARLKKEDGWRLEGEKGRREDRVAVRSQIAALEDGGTV